MRFVSHATCYYSDVALVFFCPECQMLLFNFLFKLIIIARLNLYISRVMFAVTYYSIDMNSIYSSKVYFV